MKLKFTDNISQCFELSCGGLAPLPRIGETITRNNLTYRINNVNWDFTEDDTKPIINYTVTVI